MDKSGHHSLAIGLDIARAAIGPEWQSQPSDETPGQEAGEHVHFLAMGLVRGLFLSAIENIFITMGQAMFREGSMVSKTRHQGACR